MNREIFREYDIRGIVGHDFDMNDVENIGRGYAIYLHGKGGLSVVVGRDCRLHSPDVRDALVAGLIKSGIHVVDIGICPTPVLYFALRRLKVDGGIMITASHNPPEYNGFKVCVGNDTIFGKDILELRDVIESGEYEDKQGSQEKINITAEYSDFLVESIDLKRPVRLAVDAGNATGGVVAGPIFQRLGCQVKELFFDMDGRFPNHEPDPTVAENMTVLAETVVKEGLELGIGFDGDTDRIGVVNEKGEIIWGDMLMVIFAREILKEKPGAKFIGEVKCSQLMYDDIKSNGGVPIMGRTGHSLIKQKMKEEKADLAGEMSGHMFFAHRYFGYDDAIYAACRLLEIVSQSDKPLSEYLANLPKVYSTPEIRIPCSEDKKFEIVEAVKAELSGENEIIDVDGVRVIFPEGWGLLRASNTGPILVLRFEAQSEEKLTEIRSYVEGVLNKHR